jgi:hypothetical protein
MHHELLHSVASEFRCGGERVKQSLNRYTSNSRWHRSTVPWVQGQVNLWTHANILHTHQRGRMVVLYLVQAYLI